MIPLALILPSGRVVRRVAFARDGCIYAEWDESKHPRAPAGTSEGGQFISATSELNPEQTERLKSLGVPPGWRDVLLNVDPTADLQAVGRDAKGRKVYLYSAEHHARQAASKFGRLKAFNAEVSNLRAHFDRDMRSADPVTREAATVMRIIDKTAFRIGSRSETGGEVKAYGATTLRSEHVSVSGDKVSFDFVGKHGVRNVKMIEDRQLARELAPRIERGGELFRVREQQVRDYLHDRDGEFMVKDFRTWHGTNRALELVRSLPVPETKTAFQKSVAQVSREVAAHLGNTPAVARGSYIDPAVFSAWQARAFKGVK